MNATEPDRLPPLSWADAIETAVAAPIPSESRDLTTYCLLLQGIIGTLLRDKCPEGMALTTAQMDAFRRNEGPAFDARPCDGGITVFRAIQPTGS